MRETKIGELYLAPNGEWIKKIGSDQSDWTVLILKDKGNFGFWFECLHGKISFVDQETDMDSALQEMALGEEDFDAIDRAIELGAIYAKSEISEQDYIKMYSGFDVVDLIKTLESSFSGRYQAFTEEGNLIIAFKLDQPIRHIGQLFLAIASKIDKWSKNNLQTRKKTREIYP